MNETNLIADLEKELAKIPLLDAHTHMDAQHLIARGLDDVMLYHMVVSDLYSAGCPSGGRMSEWPDEKESTSRIEEAIPFLPRVRNTAINWGLRTILSDLYGWNEPITKDNWRKLDAIIKAKAGDGKWAREILNRANIKRTCTESWRGHDGSADDIFQYSLEWAFFARCQWGEFDAILYDLEYSWQQSKPVPPLPVTTGGLREPVKREVKTVEDVDAAIDHYVKCFPFDKVLSTAQHISTDINYRLVSREEMTKALANRKHAGPADQDVYSSYIFEKFLTVLENAPNKIVFQFSFAAEPLPFESGSRIRQDTLSQLAQIIARHPKLQFQSFVSSLHANQTLCTFCRELPNLSLAGYWWHNFFPPFIQRVIAERLDMVALNKQVGFFSDAYTAEWAYAKVIVVRKMMARVLAEKISTGQYTKESALDIAREILYVTPQTLLGMVPKKE